MGRTTIKKAVAVTGIAAILFAGASTSSTAARLITGADIRNNSVATEDIKDGTILNRDINPEIRSKFLKDNDTKYNDNALKAQIADLEDRIEALEAEDESGVNTNWQAKDGATIVDENTVTVSNAGTPAGSSVEIANLDLPVQATKTVVFTYELADGAAYSAGSPRIFLEISGTYYNTFDAAPEDAGVDNGDGTFTKTWTIPANGRVGNAGIVQDSGAGTITVSDVTISGTPIKFQ